MTLASVHPLIDWLYNSPSWLVGLGIVGVTVVYSLLGLLVVHRLVDRRLRQDHNDITGATSAIVGTVAAVLLAFISVATWETFSRDQDIADSESATISNLYFGSFSIRPDNVRVSVQNHLRRYVRIVVSKEWPAQREDRFVPSLRTLGRAELLAINHDLAAMNPQTIGDGNIQSQLMTLLNQLVTARRERLIAAHGHVDAVVWRVILMGTALAIGYTWLFGPRDLRLHMVLTGTLAASLALVIYLIVVTDYPFRGAVSIRSDSYEAALVAMRGAAQ